MKNVFNCGDIVTFHKGNSNGMSIYWWCKVLDLILRSEGDKSYDSYEVVTGCGDLNTDILFHLKHIGISKKDTNSNREIIRVDNGSVFYTDKSHDIYLIKTEDMEKSYIETIDIAKNRIEFIRLNKNRNEKLDDILSDN
jgi:hypothetical protein